MAITMAGGEEGNGNGDNGVGQGRVMATRRAVAAATRVAGDKEGKAGKGSKGQGYSNEDGGRQRGQSQGWQGQW
jgi:hypothetical protein